MQLFRRAPEENPEDFWRQTAEKRGGKIGFFTFATFIGKSSDKLMGLPGLLYTVGEAVWFEDFERDNWLSRIISSRQKYEKTELTFQLSEIRFTRIVSRVGASRSIGGAVSPEKLAPASFFTKVFSTPVAELGLTDGSALFFEIMQRKEFFALVPNR
jgi:hypothetical protein